MNITFVPAEKKPTPFLSQSSHARLRHDWALWHPDHVDEVLRKQSVKLPFVHKSKFHSFAIAEEAIDQSAKYPALKADNGYLITTFDMGYQTGIDFRSNEPVSAVTVVTRPNGEVVTAYPGTSWKN